MSADRCVVYFGVRYDVPENETEPLEARTDARLVAARTGKLKHYWSNFGGLGSRHLLFIGREIGIFGPEDKMEIDLRHEDLTRVMDETRAMLIAAGFTEAPRLYIQWEEDV